MNAYPLERTDLVLSDHIGLRHVADAAALAHLEVHFRPVHGHRAPEDWHTKAELPCEAMAWGYGPEAWK